MRGQGVVLDSFCRLRSKDVRYVCVRKRVGLASLATCAGRVLWYVRVGTRVGLASVAACARRVVGTCLLENAWADRLRSKGALVCVRRKMHGLACARKLVGMCAFEIAWGSLCSPHALEGCFGMCASDMVGTQNYDITAAAAAAAKGFLIHCI